MNPKNFEYTFQVILFHNTLNTIVSQDTHTLHNVNNIRFQSNALKSNIVYRKRINNLGLQNDALVLYVSDMTNYREDQPLLQLSLNLSEAFQERLIMNTSHIHIPLHFAVDHTNHQVRNRRIQFQLPPIDEIVLSLNIMP